MKLSTFSYGLVSASLASALSVHPREDSNSQKYIADCLGDKDVPVLWPADEKYDDYAEPFNLRLQYKPAVIVLPTTDQHVQDAVTCASQSGLSVSAPFLLHFQLDPLFYQTKLHFLHYTVFT
jgi:hypothetical protein